MFDWLLFNMGLLLRNYLQSAQQQTGYMRGPMARFSMAYYET